MISCAAYLCTQVENIEEGVINTESPVLSWKPKQYFSKKSSNESVREVVEEVILEEVEIGEDVEEQIKREIDPAKDGDIGRSEESVIGTIEKILEDETAAISKERLFESFKSSNQLEAGEGQFETKQRIPLIFEQEIDEIIMKSAEKSGSKLKKEKIKEEGVVKSFLNFEYDFFERSFGKCKNVIKKTLYRHGGEKLNSDFTIRSNLFLVFRHGKRFPTNYSQIANEKKELNGALTFYGIKQLYALGQEFKRKFGTERFLNNAHYLSSNIVRCMKSLSYFLLGIMSSSETLELELVEVVNVKKNKKKKNKKNKNKNKKKGSTTKLNKKGKSKSKIKKRKQKSSLTDLRTDVSKISKIGADLVGSKFTNYDIKKMIMEEAIQSFSEEEESQIRLEEIILNQKKGYKNEKNEKPRKLEILADSALDKEILTKNIENMKPDKKISAQGSLLTSLNSENQEMSSLRNDLISQNNFLKTGKSYSKMKHVEKSKRKIKSWRPKSKVQSRMFANIEQIMRNLRANDSYEHLAGETISSVPISTESDEIFDLKHRTKCKEKKNRHLCMKLNLNIDSVIFETPSTKFDFIFNPLKQLE